MSWTLGSQQHPHANRPHQHFLSEYHHHNSGNNRHYWLQTAIPLQHCHQTTPAQHYKPNPPPESAFSPCHNLKPDLKPSGESEGGSQALCNPHPLPSACISKQLPPNSTIPLKATGQQVCQESSIQLPQNNITPKPKGRRRSSVPEAARGAPSARASQYFTLFRQPGSLWRTCLHAGICASPPRCSAQLLARIHHPTDPSGVTQHASPAAAGPGELLGPCSSTQSSFSQQVKPAV